MKERFPGELETLRADNARLRRLLELSEEQARGARPDQATLTGAPTTPVSKQSPFHDKVRFYIDLFRCRSDVYAIRWENRRDGRSGWMPAVRGGYWRKGMSRSEAPFLPLTNDVVDKHLQGEIHIGLYPLLDDDTCWWVAADFDKEAAMSDALAFMKAARALSIPPLRKCRSQVAVLTCGSSSRRRLLRRPLDASPQVYSARHSGCVAACICAATTEYSGPRMSTRAAVWAM